MMRKYLSLLAFFSGPAWASAPTLATYDTVCINGAQLTETVQEFRELPYVRGISHGLDEVNKGLSLVVFVNPTTGSFTIVERAEPDLYCILAIGSGFEPVPRDVQDRARGNQL
jgi:hypothetical protein